MFLPPCKSGAAGDWSPVDKKSYQESLSYADIEHLRINKACGPISTFNVLQLLGVDVSYQTVEQQFPGFQDRGTKAGELIAYLKRNDLEVEMTTLGSSFYADNRLAGDWVGILCLQPKGSPLGHYVTAVPAEDGLQILDGVQKPKTVIEKSLAGRQIILVSRTAFQKRWWYGLSQGWLGNSLLLVGVFVLLLLWLPKFSKARAPALSSLAARSVFFLAVVGHLASCSRQEEALLPKVATQELKHDFGTVLLKSQGEKRKTQFLVKNPTAQTLHLRKCVISCSCTETLFPRREVEPGGVFVIDAEVKFDVHRSGPLSVDIIALFEGLPDPLAKISIVAEVKPEAMVTPILISKGDLIEHDTVDLPFTVWASRDIAKLADGDARPAAKMEGLDVDVQVVAAPGQNQSLKENLPEYQRKGFNYIARFVVPSAVGKCTSVLHIFWPDEKGGRFSIPFEATIVPGVRLASTVSIVEGTQNGAAGTCTLVVKVPKSDAHSEPPPTFACPDKSIDVVSTQRQQSGDWAIVLSIKGPMSSKTKNVVYNVLMGDRTLPGKLILLP